MSVVSELSRLITESNLVAVKPPRLDVVDEGTLKMTYAVPEVKGEVVLVQHADYSGEADWPGSPEVSLNTLTRRVVVQPGQRNAPISEVHATGKQRVLVTGIALEVVTAGDKSNVLVRTDSAPKTSATGKGKVTIKPTR